MTLEEKRSKASDLCAEYADCSDCPCHAMPFCVCIDEASEEELDSMLKAFEDPTTPVLTMDDLGSGERIEIPGKPEMVDHPAHYQGRHECIEVMKAMYGDEAVKSFCRCSAFKYRFRADSKGRHDEDIKKAEWYEEYLMKMEGRIK